MDSTTEAEIARQIATDNAAALADAGHHIREIRHRLGLTQPEFAARINVSVETIRNWEQGKRGPTGAARALLRILDRAPDTALAALS